MPLPPGLCAGMLNLCFTVQYHQSPNKLWVVTILRKPKNFVRQRASVLRQRTHSNLECQAILRADQKDS